MTIGHPPEGITPVSRVQLVTGHTVETQGSPPALTAIPAPGIGFYLRSGKRALDLALGTALFAALSPVIAGVGLLVLLTCGRPIFYASERMGRGGRPFRMWKFRTMVADADRQRDVWQHTHPHLASELASNWKLNADPRVTALGRLLRRSSLDELPQFWNVLRGEMSLVGPRPYLVTETLDPASADTILSMRPGLTGPFQVRGRHGMPPVSRMKIEAAYASEAALATDVAYMIKTVRPLLKMDGQ